MDRSQIQPILEAIPAERQKDARHYGVHPYFTRRPPNVVRAYIERYSHDGDVVCDPFGGTGVTAIEAFLLGRSAIHNDLNPFANFIVQCVSDVSLAVHRLALQHGHQSFTRRHYRPTRFVFGCTGVTCYNQCAKDRIFDYEHEAQIGHRIFRVARARRRGTSNLGPIWIALVQGRRAFGGTEAGNNLGLRKASAKSQPVW